MISKEEILIKLSDIVKDEGLQQKIQTAADGLFPILETLLDYKTEQKIEDLVMAYADAHRRSGFVDGYNTAVFLLSGGDRMLIRDESE